MLRAAEVERAPARVDRNRAGREHADVDWRDGGRRQRDAVLAELSTRQRRVVDPEIQALAFAEGVVVVEPVALADAALRDVFRAGHDAVFKAYPPNGREVVPEVGARTRRIRRD